MGHRSSDGMRLGPIGTGAPLPLATGLRRGSGCPAAGALAVREHTRRAVLRCGHQGDGRRSGVSFGARAGSVGGAQRDQLPRAVLYHLQAGQPSSVPAPITLTRTSGTPRVPEFACPLANGEAPSLVT